MPENVLLEQHVRIRLGHNIISTVNAVQYDTAREFYFIFDDCDVPVDAELRIYVRKPSGKEIYNYCHIANGEVVVQPTLQMLAEKGRMPGQLQIIKNHVKLTSFAFYLNVEENLIGSSSITSTNEFLILDELIDNARIAINEMVDLSDTVKTEEAARVVAEGGRGEAENVRKAEEVKRASQENMRKSSETERANSENQRKQNEIARGIAEAGRENTEKLRLASENERVGSENTRKLAESAREDGENLRDSAETSRINKENERKLAESNRTAQEGKRVEAEKKRVTEFNTLKSDSETATRNANNATNNANEKAVLAETAGNRANEVVETIEQKVQDGEFSATVEVGTVITGDSGTSAQVENVGTPKDLILNFTIPKGDTGAGGVVNMADPVFTGSFSQNRRNETPIGNYSHAEGLSCAASGNYSHAEGLNCAASGNRSHAEGFCTLGSEDISHAEGDTTIASGYGSHTEGGETKADGIYSHAEGNGTTASGTASHAEGSSGKALGLCSHAEGKSTVALGESSHAGGDDTIASGSYSHSEGYYTVASNVASYSGGKNTRPMADGGALTNQVGDAFLIGNGTDRNVRMLSNAFRITYTGSVYAAKDFQSPGADYAEYIYPWADGNTRNEDRVGYFVTVDNQSIRIAQPIDYIAGIISGAPSVVGSADEDWLGRYERDSFNRVIMEDVPEMAEKKDENGNTVYDEETHMPIMVETGNIVKNARMKQVSDYDPSTPYTERKYRPEWDYVGMLGVIPVRDDGTCVPSRFCKCGNGGIATLCEERQGDSWMVIERVGDNVVKVIMR